MQEERAGRIDERGTSPRIRTPSVKKICPGRTGKKRETGGGGTKGTRIPTEGGGNLTQEGKKRRGRERSAGGELLRGKSVGSETKAKGRERLGLGIWEKATGAANP